MPEGDSLPLMLLVSAKHISPTNIAGSRITILGSIITDRMPVISSLMLGCLKTAICCPLSRTMFAGSTITNTAAAIALDVVLIIVRI